MKSFLYIAVILTLFIGTFFETGVKPVFSASMDKVKELQEKINKRNQEMADVEKEIKKYENEINNVQKDANVFKTQIKQLETTANKLNAEIKLTNQNISTATLTIEQIGVQIDEKIDQMEQKKEALAEIIRKMNEEEADSLVEMLLANNNLSEFFDNLSNMENIQKKINTTLGELTNLKQDLEKQQSEKETEKSKLEKLSEKISDQKKIAEINKAQTSTLLKQTKSKESVYKKMLAGQIEKRNALEREVLAYEEQIRTVVDPTTLPKTGAGVLVWPVVDVFITQYFGNTPFATANPQLYNNGGHNGIDLRASVGTPIKSAKSGIVMGTGDTDPQCAGVSYGKWVLIKHDNNLATLYAHLSLVKVSEGQNVALGEVVGYAGLTGYTTGPHLHFTVFAAPAVKISIMKSKICGTDMRLPLAPINGYLNPLSYL